MKIKVAAVVGPTASGKTALAIELAKIFSGEIISCDSMQIYKEMDIGTAKPTAEEISSAPHHLIDIVDPDVEFSCADYVDLAHKKINEVNSKGRMPILCGGTGLYFDHVLSNTTFSEAGRDEEYRKELAELLDEKGVDYLYEMLKKVDPESAAASHPNNVKRNIRALEIYHLTGKTKSFWDGESKKNEPLYDSRVILLDFREREKLYDRIDCRVDKMISMGLVEEVERLYKKDGFTFSKTALQGIGYKEIIEFLDGKISLDEAVEKIKKGTRNYAKRQLTWFRRYVNINRIFVDCFDEFDEIVNIAKNVISD